MAEGSTRLQDWAPTLGLLIVVATVTGLIWGKFRQGWALSRPIRTGLGFAIIFTVSTTLIRRRRKAIRLRETR